jgi:sirohydrochlorin ferrochelatase
VKRSGPRQRPGPSATPGREAGRGHDWCAYAQGVSTSHDRSGADEVVGVIVVDHGSRRREANQRHVAFVDAWQDGVHFGIVEPAHMELAEPSIGTAFDACVAAGATTVVIAPYFLWPGNHWDRDIPAIADEAAARHPGVRHLVAAPLGPHPLLLDIVEQRVDYCLAHAAGEAPECTVCAGTGRCRMR